VSTFGKVRRTAWDTETTGPNPLEDRIVTAAFIVRGGGKPDADLSWLINPGIEIPAEATEVHGITNEMVQSHGLEPKVALDEIANCVTYAIEQNLPLIAFNQSFDWSILHYDLKRNGLETVEDRLGASRPMPLVDPHVIDKQVDKYVKGTGMRKLKPTAERYGVELADWHTAEADALAALLIAEAQFAKHKYLAAMGPERLFTSQQKWRADQQAGLQQWFRTKATEEQGGDPNKVIDGSWPLIPTPRTGGQA
jgi:DNA polymerase-3 subunit epsilon